MTHAPVDQAVQITETAQFTCAGTGSFISISWEYSEVCGSDGENCEAAVSDEANKGEIQHRLNSSLIISTLFINTSMLRLQLGRSYSIRCIMHQNVPPEYNLQGESQTVHARLMLKHTGTDIAEI